MTFLLAITGFGVIAKNSDLFRSPLFHPFRSNLSALNKWRAYFYFFLASPKKHFVKSDGLAPFGLFNLFNPKLLPGLYNILFSSCLNYCKIHSIRKCGKTILQSHSVFEAAANAIFQYRASPAVCLSAVGLSVSCSRCDFSISGRPWVWRD